MAVTPLWIQHVCASEYFKVEFGNFVLSATYKEQAANHKS